MTVVPIRDPSRALHIAVDARTINSSTGTVIVRLLQHLQQIDVANRYTIILSERDRDYWRPIADNFTTAFIDAPPYSFAEQLRLRTLVKGIGPDIIHFCMPQQPLFFYGGRKITSFHDLTTLRIRNPHLSTPAYLVKNAIGRFAFWRAAHESARVICCSQWTRNDVMKTFRLHPDVISMIYDAGDTDDSPQLPFDHPFDEFLLYVGSHFEYKNLKRLCDAHQRLLEGRPGLGLIMVGRPDRESAFTQRYCEERGYKNIMFTGYLPNEQRNWLYAQTAAYVFPSLSEGFGLPGLEAMGYGAPVVSSDRTCLPEIYGDGAAYFDPEDVADMATSIGRVLNDPALRADLIARGTERFGRYSWRRAAEEVLAVYQDVGSATALRAPRRHR